nr:leucine-rich repeat domain-containing protein [uncultured Oscillibacter sp.]
MKNWRLGLSLALGLALSLVLLCGTALAAEAASGSWTDYKLRPGYGGTWTLDSEGTLTFEGKGVIPPEEPNGWAEWLPHRDSVRKIVIGSGVTELTYHVFAEYKELQAVEIPESVTAILDGAFRGCVSLTSVTIPASVVSLSTPQEEGERVYHGAFGGCTGLREADIAARDIGPRAFTGCSSLSRVTLREGVETIGDDAFLNCVLEELTLPASLQEIGPGALYNNTYLNNIEVAAGSTAYQSINGVVFSRDGSELTLCPRGKRDASSFQRVRKPLPPRRLLAAGG